MSDELQQDELQTLKARADTLGVSYHPSIGVDALKKKVNDKLTSTESEDVPADDEPEAKPATKETENQFRLRKRKEAEELIRIQVTCMNPNKREWEGEMFTVGNSIIGTLKKMVPFDVEWHVPRAIFNAIKERQTQIFVTRRDERGRQIREGKLIREFSVAELPPLTEKELKELGQRQSMASGTQA